MEMRYMQINVDAADFYMLKPEKMCFAVVELNELENFAIAFRIAFLDLQNWLFWSTNRTSFLFHMFHKYKSMCISNGLDSLEDST